MAVVAVFFAGAAGVVVGVVATGAAFVGASTYIAAFNASVFIVTVTVVVDVFPACCCCCCFCSCRFRR